MLTEALPIRNGRPGKGTQVDTQNVNLGLKSKLEVDKKDADEALQALEIVVQEELRHDVRSDRRLLWRVDLIIMRVGKNWTRDDLRVHQYE